jgi:hypothetical protein
MNKVQEVTKYKVVSTGSNKVQEVTKYKVVSTASTVYIRV